MWDESAPIWREASLTEADENEEIFAVNLLQ